MKVGVRQIYTSKVLVATVVKTVRQTYDSVLVALCVGTYSFVGGIVCCVATTG